MNLKDRLKEYEGTKAYQAKLGYVKNGKFNTYTDSLGYPTLGYGHLLNGSQTFPLGITEVQADELLDRDISIARTSLSTLQLALPDDWNDFMIIMIFQLGIAGVKKFKMMLQALHDKNYKEAVKQAKASLWFSQTPNRVNSMIAVLTNK